MKNKGFTLIELLAVIIILGILMIIAIPSVTKYINDSRKSSYIDTAKEIIAGARNMVNDGKLEMYDTDMTYYIDVNCIKTENGEATSPYGSFTKAYVAVTYDGKGYDYYWTSVDDAGEGIRNLIKFDNLDPDQIESDMKDSDISTLRGIDGRSRTTVVSKANNCQKEGSNPANTQINGNTGVEFNPVCRRATILHTEECSRVDRGCYDKGYYIGGTKNTTTITYGNLGQNGSLSIGDAFDCDVNGDGEYNSTTERFYYVTTEDNYAVLLYYNNVSDGSPNNIEKYKYDSIDENWHGPREGYKQLPSTSLWKNVSLRNQTRQIYAGASGWSQDTFNLLQTNGGATEIFTYTDKAARFLTLEEVRTQCRDGKYKLLDQCEFLFENTQYNHKNEQHVSTPVRYWLETPYTDNNSIYWLSGDEYSTGAWYASVEYGIRPVIEVPLQDIYY